MIRYNYSESNLRLTIYVGGRSTGIDLVAYRVIYPRSTSWPCTPEITTQFHYISSLCTLVVTKIRKDISGLTHMQAVHHTEQLYIYCVYKFHML